MKYIKHVKYNGRDCVSLTHGKEYEVLAIENGWFRIMDDTDEDYLFPPDDFDVPSRAYALNMGDFLQIKGKNDKLD